MLWSHIDVVAFFHMLAISVGVYLLSKTETFFGFSVTSEYLQTLWPLCVTSHVLCRMKLEWERGNWGFAGWKLLPFLGMSALFKWQIKTFFLICRTNVINDTNLAKMFCFTLYSKGGCKSCSGWAQFSSTNNIRGIFNTIWVRIIKINFL